MSQICLIRAKSCVSETFTISGKPRTPHLTGARRGRTSSLILLLVMATPVHARPQIGPTSSASVEISLSVAPNYALRTEEPAIRIPESGASGSGIFCIATNGQPMPLPIMLVRPLAGQAEADGTATEWTIELPWCGAGGAAVPAPADQGNDAMAPGAFIIRPE